jgi:hypothetical protein
MPRLLSGLVADVNEDADADVRDMVLGKQAGRETEAHCSLVSVSELWLGWLNCSSAFVRWVCGHNGFFVLLRANKATLQRGWGCNRTHTALQNATRSDDLLD